MNSKVVDTEKIEKDTALKIAELFMKEIGLERHAKARERRPQKAALQRLIPLLNHV